jgi:ribosomal protein L11 methyltransferase
LPVPQWIEVAFPVEAERCEELIAQLYEMGAGGVEERDQTTFQKSRTPDQSLVVVWIPVAEAKNFLQRAADSGLPPPLEHDVVRDEDEWRDVWKKFFTPRKVGRFVIVPGWENYSPAPGETVIDMDPGRAFGTGGHPSTRLCLQAISQLDAIDRFLDVGCGSGVLAIATAKGFPRSSGIGVDIDPDSVEVSRENGARNGIAERVSFSNTPVEEVHGPFDLVLANILPDVLVPLAPVLAARLSPGGNIVLSGILVELADHVEQVYCTNGLVLRDRLDEEGWRALVLERPVHPVPQ